MVFPIPLAVHHFKIIGTVTSKIGKVHVSGLPPERHMLQLQNQPWNCKILTNPSLCKPAVKKSFVLRVAYWVLVCHRKHRADLCCLCPWSVWFRVWDLIHGSSPRALKVALCGWFSLFTIPVQEYYSSDKTRARNSVYGFVFYFKSSVNVWADVLVGCEVMFGKVLEVLDF